MSSERFDCETVLSWKVTPYIDYLQCDKQYSTLKSNRTSKPLKIYSTIIKAK